METDYFAEIRGKDLKEGMTVYLPDGMRQGGQLPEEESAGNTAVSYTHLIAAVPQGP